MRKTSEEPQGVIFNLQKFSLHDGPGIRTTVFLKGCPLRCFWCCNPESQSPAPEVSRNAARCLGAERCGACLAACGHGALAAGPDGIRRDRSRCVQCGACAAACPVGAVSLVGEHTTASAVLRRVLSDEAFFAHSGGGLTLSGGEALFQPEFALALLRGAQEHGLHTAMETCAHVPYERMQAAAPLLDHLLADVKCMDPAAHRRATGAGNSLILANLGRLAAEFPSLPLTLRMPVVPGFNDTPDEVREVARFAGRFPSASLELLPYHRLGEGKYANLGLDYAFADQASPGVERMAALRDEAGRYARMV